MLRGEKSEKTVRWPMLKQKPISADEWVKRDTSETLVLRAGTMGV